MLRPRALALLTVALLVVAGPPAGPASAAPPRAPLTAVPNADGSQSLHWSLEGTSDSINVLPHLRCAADPLADGVFAGSPVPCVWLVDHRAPPSPGPVGCPATASPYASWRCDMRRFRDLTIDAAAAGESSLIMFNTRPDGGSGLCAWIPLAVRLGPGTGAVRAADGCRERIACAAGYAGRVDADALDVLSGCARVARTTAVAPVGTGSTSAGSSGSSGGSRVDLAACPGAGSGRTGDSPLYSVRITPRGRRGSRVVVTMRRAVPITVEVRVKRRSGSELVRWTPRCATAGRNVVVFPDATGGRRARRNYRVVVRSPNSTYPLRSSYETLPRR